jgi:ABC-type bacteriocin/lantibiotic exporter with double-glycine peptidase domain
MSANARDHSRTRRLRFIAQTGNNDCGPASLTTVLHYFDRFVPFGEVCSRFSIMAKGVTALDLIRVAQTFGLSGRGLWIPSIDDLRYLPMAAILHWRERHFFVLEEVTAGSVIIMDPALGRTQFSLHRFARHFSNRAVIFEVDGS